MKKEFQSKDIRRMLGVNQERVAYLSEKISIIPEIEEVEGTGRAHIYSFRNALQFAFAHYLGRLGLGPRAIKQALTTLERADQGKALDGLTVRIASGTKLDLFDPDMPPLEGVCLFRVESRWPDKPEREGLLKFAVMNDQGFLSEELELSRQGKKVFGYHVLRLDTIKSEVVEYAKKSA